MKSTLIFLSISAIIGICFGHTLHLGRICPSIQPFPNLSLDKILGKWYVTYKFDTSNTCLIWNITRSQTNPEMLEITETRQLYLLEAVGYDHIHAVTARLEVPNPEVPAELRIRWPTSLTGKADFVIFDTDYDNYMAIFQCDRAGLVHRRDVVILSRAPIMNELFIKRVRRLLDTTEVTHKDLSLINHENCRNPNKPDWHIKGELFGLIPPATNEEIRRIAEGIKDYDITDLEIIGEGVSKMSQTTKENIEQTKVTL